MLLSQKRSLLGVTALSSSLAVLLLASSSYAAKGLHYSDAEISIWKQRAQVGPYKTKNTTNYTPGDYDRIKANANAFIANPMADKWDGGPAISGCIPKLGQASYQNYEPHAQGQKLRDAGFVYLLTGDNRYADYVIDVLVAQAKEPKLNFDNRTRWCRFVDLNPGFAITEWLLRVIFAYDYTKDRATSTERTLIENWLKGAGRFFQMDLDLGLNSLYKDRNAGVIADVTARSKVKTQTHHGGYNIPNISYHYNNRRATIARTLAHLAVMFNDASLKKTVTLFFKEWVKYSVFPDGTHAEYYRGHKDLPTQGLNYTCSTLADMIAIADVFARAGDKSLYDYTTGDGLGATKGGSKNLRLALQNLEKYINKSFARYLVGYPNNETYRIGAYDGVKKTTSVFDIWFAQANVYYKDSLIKSTYMRKYPTTPTNSGPHHPWSSVGATYPGVLFMFGDMEGKVNPFGTAPATTPAPTPAPTAKPVPTPTPVPSVSTTITVNLKGSPANGVYAHFNLLVDGVKVGDRFSTASNANYTFTVAKSFSTIKKVIVHFDNDLSITGADRNLFVNSINVGGKALTPKIPGVTLDTGALDGKDVIPGQVVIPWNAYLIFPIN